MKWLRLSSLLSLSAVIHTVMSGKYWDNFNDQWVQDSSILEGHSYDENGQLHIRHKSRAEGLKEQLLKSECLSQAVYCAPSTKCKQYDQYHREGRAFLISTEQCPFLSGNYLSDKQLNKAVQLINQKLHIELENSNARYKVNVMVVYNGKKSSSDNQDGYKIVAVKSNGVKDSRFTRREKMYVQNLLNEIILEVKASIMPSSYCNIDNMRGALHCADTEKGK